MVSARVSSILTVDHGYLGHRAPGARGASAPEPVASAAEGTRTCPLSQVSQTATMT